MLYAIGMDKQKARELYLQGYSCREVGSMVGANSGNVYRVIADIARSKLRPDTKNARTNRNRARKIMEQQLGRKLERLEHVHHINGDPVDNRLENLALLSASEHLRHHHDKGLGSVTNPREYKRQQYLNNKEHMDAYHRTWRKNNPEKVAAIRAAENVARRQFQHSCAFCGEDYRGLKHSRFCSLSCGSKQRWSQS